MNCRHVAAAVFIGLIMLVPGCGRKTPLVPPQRLVPVKITNLAYALDEKGVTLRWSYPVRMENGDSLQAIERFDLYRAVMPEEEFCPGCPVRYEEPLEIAGGQVPPGGGRTAVYQEGDLRSGYRYFYKIRSLAGKWYASGDSNVVSFVWYLPPKMPAGLEAEAGDRSVTLRWEPVRENTADTPLEQPVRYQVFRRTGSEDFTARGLPLQETEFIDTGLVNAEQYIYQVRAVVVYGDTVQAGGASKTAAAVPRDLTPPSPPQHLVAVAIPGGVRLVWQAAAGEDLAGYRVYRRTDDAGRPELIAELGPGQNQYIDQTPGSGSRLYYSITSFDAAQPANESLPTAEEAIELP